MRILENLEPKRVFHYFEDICSVPHGSGNTAAISDYCVRFAKEQGLFCHRDELGSIIIKKPASKGYEDHPAVILQGHLDMVCACDEGVMIDMEKEGIKLKTDGEFVSACGTTLGGDNGIAVAMIMALLEDKNACHPPVEALFTVDEETGMFGAEALDATLLSGKMLINIDSEEEGVFTVSCAGGARARFEFSFSREEVSAPVYKIKIDGLKGGHSGVEIDKGGQNADILMGKLLKGLPEVRICSIAGGLKDNAIPSSCECVISCETDPAAAVLEFEKQNRIPTDEGLKITVAPAQANDCFTSESSAAVIEFLTTVKNGIITMSEDIKGLVQTSLNLGYLATQGDRVVASFAVRSSLGEEKKALLADLKKTAEKLGADFIEDNFYPAWEYKKESRLRDTMCRVWEEISGKSAAVSAIHAGLECGLFCEKIEGLDAVSMGPDMFDVHTPRERLSVSSTERVYNYLREVLAAL